MKRDNSLDSKFHEIRLQLSSEQLIELFTWLHDKTSASTRGVISNHPVENLRSTILAHMLANLDVCKKPYVALDSGMVIPVTQARLEKLAFGGDCDLGTAKSSPADYLENPGPYAQSGPDAFSDPVLDMEQNITRDDADEANAGETAELDEGDTQAYLDELHKDN